MRSVTSSNAGKMMPVNTSRDIFPQHVTFGRRERGRETDGHIEILKIKQKEMLKDDPDVKNFKLP